MTQNLGITDEVLLTGRVASGDITDDAELRKELEKIYPTENWSDINRLMKAMKTRATRQSGGTTEVVDGEVVHTMGMFLLILKGEHMVRMYPSKLELTVTAIQ